METSLILLLGLAFVGCCSGFVAGLLGVGGGIIIVPALMALFTAFDYAPEAQMQMSVGTSLAIICGTSVSSIRAHYKRGAIDLSVLKLWTLPIILGVLIGGVTAQYLSSEYLTIFFAILLLLVAVKMTFSGKLFTQAGVKVSRWFEMFLVTIIGFASSMAGIGGGSLSVPLLTVKGKDIKIAVGTSSAIGALIAFPGTIAFVLVDLYLNDHSYKWAIGSVNYMGVALIAPTAILFAPLGAKTAHQIDSGRLKKIFAAFLLIVSVKMLYSAL